MGTNNEKVIRIIDLEKSNLRLKIAIGVLIITILISFVYSFVQQGIAQEWEKFATEQEHKAINAAEEALKQQKIAELNGKKRNDNTKEPKKL